MKKCKEINLRYVRSDKMEVQGSLERIKKICKREGYEIKESRNGYWVLIKRAKVFITTERDVTPQNIKGDILDHYGKQRISESLVKKFMQDINKEKVCVYLDDRGFYVLKSPKAS